MPSYIKVEAVMDKGSIAYYSITTGLLLLALVLAGLLIIGFWPHA